MVVTTSSSLLTFAVFAVFLYNISITISTSYLNQLALDRWDNMNFGLPYLSQESMVLSQLQLSYLYYLQPSLTVSQN